MASILILLLGGGGLAALYWAAGSHYLPDLALFAAHPIGAGVLLLAAIVARGIIRWLGILLVLGGIAYIVGTMAVSQGYSAVSKNEGLRVVTYNVLHGTADIAALRAELAALEPDVVVLEECAPPCSSLKKWTEFQTRIQPFQTDTAILSPHPLAVPILRKEDPSVRLSTSAVRVELLLPDAAGESRPVVVYGIHPKSPHSRAYWRARNAELEDFAARGQQDAADNPVIIAGDWNTPPLSPHFRRFLATTGFVDTERSIWPATTRYFRELGMPTVVGGAVDRVVTSRHFRPIDHRIGRDLGSDHLPVIVDLELEPIPRTGS